MKEAPQLWVWFPIPSASPADRTPESLDRDNKRPAVQNGSVVSLMYCAPFSHFVCYGFESAHGPFKASSVEAPGICFQLSRTVQPFPDNLRGFPPRGLFAKRFDNLGIFPAATI